MHLPSAGQHQLSIQKGSSDAGCCLVFKAVRGEDLCRVLPCCNGRPSGKLSDPCQVSALDLDLDAS